jgi:hypothetical protein
MKIRRKLRGEIKWRHFAPGNDEPTNPMCHVPQDERDAIRVEMFGIICKQKHRMTSIAAVCSAAAAYQIGGVNS